MAQRTRWQYCQIEVGTENAGVLKQFFPEREPVETALHQGWSSMLAKLGDQGWELVNAFPNEGGRSKSPVTYVLKRPLAQSTQNTLTTPVQTQQPAPSTSTMDVDHPTEPEEPDFRPLDLPDN